MSDFILHLGDCLDPVTGLASLPSCSLDAMVTDPPAGIGFMGKEWDGDKGGRAEWIAWLRSIMQECLRVLKPGAHALVWAIPRTSHWTATAIEEAGFEVRDVVTHHFGTGFPKSLNISKAIDAAAGAEPGLLTSGHFTSAAAQWAGWGTALKPACEHWILARKPLEGTIAASVQANGTGGLNIDACRIETSDRIAAFGSPKASAGRIMNGTEVAREKFEQNPQGRWPANLVLSHSPDCVPVGCAEGCPVAELDAQSGTSAPKVGRTGRRGGSNAAHMSRDKGDNAHQETEGSWPSDPGGGASRFFYVAKPSTSEREEGLGHLPKKNGADITNRDEDSAGINNPRAGAGRTSAGRANHHPTVKSVALISWLVKLVSPAGATILDPFAGSGTTGVAATQIGRKFVGWEREPEYHAIALARLQNAREQLSMFGGAA